MITKLTKTAVVLKMQEDDGLVVSFNNLKEEDRPSDSLRSVVFLHETWVKLGSPKEITVTIEPGNTLEKE